MVDITDGVHNRDTGAYHSHHRGGPATLSPQAQTVARHRHPRQISPVIMFTIVRLAEFAAVVLTGINLYYAYVWSKAPDMELAYWVVTTLAGLATVAALEALGRYRSAARRGYVSQSAVMLGVWMAVFATMITWGFFTRFDVEFSRVWLSLWFLAGAAGLLLIGLGTSLTTRIWIRERRLQRRAVIIGGGPRAGELIKALDASPDSDVAICGLFDDRGPARSPNRVGGYTKLGTVEELTLFARQTHIDLLIVALPVTAEKRLLEILRQLWVLPVDIRLSAHTAGLKFLPRAYSYIGSVPFFDILDKPLQGWSTVVKAIEDRCLAAVALVLAAPVMALVALAIKLDSKGPVLFRQNRYGFNNELIGLYKFRSMYTDQTDANAERLVTRGDPRVTRVGRFIRRTSLDELPQLFNVLTGRLSLVGPRPHAIMAKAADRLYNDVVDGYFARHRVKPGITGWAQVNGWRGETDTAEKLERRVEHDLYYIENWSVLFDLYILCITPFALMHTEQAH
ncbi:MAG: undecaprenyl-phosphate glucose phosphotransferase [Alphaproteobacteria bacterium]